MEVIWNGAVERQFAEAIRINAKAEANKRAVRVPISPWPAFKQGTHGAKLESHIRALGPGVTYTAKGVGLFLNIPRVEASVYLRRAASHGLLELVVPGGPRSGVKGGVITRYVSLGDA